jgi:uncharacterized membrane protein YhaH (DUF805 family)
MTIRQVIALALIIGVPFVAVWTENTETRVKRRGFICWIFVLLLLAPLLKVILWLFSESPESIWSVITILVLVGMAAFQFAFLRVLVRRVRDAGHKKTPCIHFPYTSSEFDTLCLSCI